MQIERLAFRANEDELGELLAQIAAHAKRLGLKPALTLKLELILEELFLNTVRYGTRGIVDSYVYLSLHASSETVRLIYEDYGLAYDPFAATDRSVLEETQATRRVGGLGVVLVEGLAQALRYARVGDCNRIELSFAVVPATR